MWVYDVVPEGVLWRVSTIRCVVSSVNSDSQKEPVHSDGGTFFRGGGGNAVSSCTAARAARSPRADPWQQRRMERELRDVVSKLTACVAMRYAAESNLQFVAETEVHTCKAFGADETFRLPLSLACRMLGHLSLSVGVKDDLRQP